MQCSIWLQCKEGGDQGKICRECRDTTGYIRRGDRISHHRIRADRALNTKKGINIFGDRDETALMKYLQKIHDMNTQKPMDASMLTY